MASLMHSTKFQGDLITILYKLFKKIEEEGPLPSTFHKASIILVPNPEKTPQERKLQTDIRDAYKCQDPQQYASKPNSTTHCKYHPP